MRIALVSPYSWTYQGGVNRHVEALAEEFIARGDHVRVLAPCDPPGRPQPPPAPRPARAPGGSRLPGPARPHVGFGANGAVSNLSPFPDGRRSRRGASCAPATSTSSTSTSRWRRWSAGTRRPSASAPVVGTFHAYSTKAVPNHIATLLGARRVVQPALRPDRRLRGGRLDRPPLVRRRLRDRPQRRRRRRGAERPEAAERGAAAPLRRPRRGAQGAADPAHRLRGPGRARALPADRDRRRARGRLALPRRPGRCSRTSTSAAASPARCSGAQLARRRPALRALALRRELRHGPDRGLRRRHAGDRLRDRRLQRRRHRRRRRRPGAARATRSASPRSCSALHHEPERLAAMGEAGRRERRALRLAAGRRPRSTAGLRAGDRSCPGPSAPPERAARRAGLVRADGGPAAPAERLPSLDPAPASAAAAAARVARRVGLGVAGVARRRPDGARGAADRRRQRRRKHRPLRPHLGADRLRADGRSRSSSAPPPGTGSCARRCPTGRCAAATSPRRR